MRNLEGLMNPKSVAVIGASREEKSVGWALLKSLVHGCVYDNKYCKPFPGEVYPVNPFAVRILGKQSYKNVNAIPGSVDLAVIAVPAKVVANVVRDCVKKKVKAITLISAGFAEAGPQGKKLQDEITAICKKAGIPLLGPNNLGIIRPSIHLNATFAYSVPPAGGVAMITQSGALADSVIDWAIKEGYAFSTMVSLGNKADLDENDFLEWCLQDKDTKAITLYLEDVKNGKRFLETAKKVTKTKPIVLLKGGRTNAGTKAAISHTAALASDYAVLKAACKQSGVILASSLEEMFDKARALAYLPRARQNAVAIITNGGGAGVLCADACEENGVNIVPLQPQTIKKLDASGVMHPAWSRSNPLDIIGDSTQKRYEVAMDAVLSEPYIQGLIVIQVLQNITDPVGNADAIIKASRKHPEKPVIAVFLGGKTIAEAIRYLQKNGIPDYDDPNKAALAMAALVGASGKVF
ncbi:MAG TPA: CoA-binding protein [Candidatus Norongarragalinales archaeon]|jgi:acetyltransferase|nr:CoA-binding protein [Candidatus Norongarragalinales archaeon]